MAQNYQKKPAAAVDLIMAAVDKYAPEYYGKREWVQAVMQGERQNLVTAIHNAIAQPVPPADERNFCERCGKRLGDSEYIHTCTPPADHIADVGNMVQPLTDATILALAHRKASTYTHRSDPTSHAYGFVAHTLIDFARAIEATHNIKPEKD